MAKRKAAKKPVSKAAARLTDKQKLFIEFYCGDARWNATAAARMAKYADPELSGWENRQKPVIQAKISERMAAAAMGADEVLARLAEHARASFKPFLVSDDNGELWPDLTTDEAQTNLHLLKKIKPKKREGGPSEERWTETEIELELHDPQAALVHIGRHHGLFKDKTEITGKDGGPIETKAELSEADRARFDKMTPNELAREYFAALGAPDKTQR